MEIAPSSFTSGIALVLLLSASPYAQKMAAPFAGSPVRGQAVYQKACTACHGDYGDGKGSGAHPLNPKPRDFMRGLYKFRSTGFGELPTDEDLLETLNKGIPGTQMPSFRNTLTPQELSDVVAYIKKFSPDFDDAEEPPMVLSIPEAPARTAELEAEGKYVYMALDCWSCHGGHGKGNGEASSALMDLWGNPIRPQDLTYPVYKRGSDAVTLYRTIHTGLNGTPMPAFQGALLYGGDKAVHDSGLSVVYSRTEIEALKKYLVSQPATSTVAAMDDETKEKLGQQRTWALVHYVRSLQKKPGILSRLFWEDTELTK